MTKQVAFRRWLLALAFSVSAVFLSVYYVDRPVAELFNVHIRHTALWDALNRLLPPFVLVPVAALFFLLGSGYWLLSGRQLSSWTLKPLLCSCSITWAVAAEFILKQMFGRAWPDPTYIEDHLYGFRFLNASPHWSSFPSGTAAISSAAIATLFLVAPRFRVPSLSLAVLLCCGVVVTNDHWISDVIAGAFIGASIGWMTVLLFRSHTTLPVA